MGFRVPAHSRVNPLLQRPSSHRRCVPTPSVGAGLPANTVAAATVDCRWILASTDMPTNENAAALLRATASDQPGGQIRRTDDAARWSRCGPGRSK
ncbi:hypothetical protein CIK02_03175 [Pseudomonas putida]|nr:hypothetical protein CIK02_03175 [Pseudomonas putida]